MAADHTGSCLDCKQPLGYGEGQLRRRAAWGQDGAWVAVCGPCYKRRVDAYSRDLNARLRARR